jgi:hypothetical protein
VRACPCFNNCLFQVFLLYIEEDDQMFHAVYVVGLLKTKSLSLMKDQQC